jgi:creatinine amidohydrolase
MWSATRGVTSVLAVLGPAVASAQGVRLADLTWVEAEQRLTPATVVVIPLGAAAKEHGPHLRLKNDLALADYFTARVLAVADVVVAPTIPYHFYPSFVEYPGSTTLSFDTARDVVVEIVRSLARAGPRRFYVLNTGISTLRPLAAARDTLAAEGILLRYTDLGQLGEATRARIGRTETGTHAGDLETSMMLYMDPTLVDMTRAVDEDRPRGEGGLTRDPAGRGTYSRSGVWGRATLATREKGALVTEDRVAAILADLAALRRASLP